MRIYNTKSQQLEEMELPHVVGIYTCGITPYDAAHIGHAAVSLTFDILQRRLRDLGHETRCVRNVTDVDDDILRKAKELDCNYLDLAAREMAKYDRNMEWLGIVPCYSEPRATSAIPEILTLVSSLLDLGLAYASEGAVYYDYTTDKSFGKLSHYSEEEMVAFARERGGNVDDPNKRHPLDFILWQPSTPGEPYWDSRFGQGRPGWHIECSALALRELGDTLAIHGGGSDLIFPHHECEIAQAEPVTGREFAPYWMHVGMVGLGGIKMSKSLGNLVFVGELMGAWDPRAVRLAIATNHYRTEWEWDDELLVVASERIALWEKSGPGDGGLEDVREHLDNDLDVHGAVRAIDLAARRGEGVTSASALLGISI